MYKRRTVFILGAGASWHYGYPTGETLAQEIRLNAEKLARYCQMVHRAGHPPRPSFIGSTQDWSKWQTDFARMGQNLREADPVVIDYFLSKNSELHEVGTLLIAWSILECEQQYRLFKNIKNRIAINPSADIDHLPNDNWVRFVSHNLIDTATDSAELLNNNIHFVTFNYDTSLEQALYGYLKNHSSIYLNHVREFIANERIIHVYGSIRDQPETPAHDRFRYKIPIDQPDLDTQEAMKHCLDAAYEAGRRLSVIEPTSKDNLDGPINSARRVIEEAEDIYILGYGFDSINSRRIGLDKVKEGITGRSPSRGVRFTNFGDSRRIQRTAKSLFFGGAFPNMTPQGDWMTQTATGSLVVEESTKNVYDALALDFEH